MATARDIARAAGVSTSTVSHVLNGTRWVSPDLRQRVLAVASDLGYEPDALARSLRTRRTNAIGLLISDISNPFFTAVVRGIQDVARARGYSLVLLNSDEDPDKELEDLHVLTSRRVDGIILAPSGGVLPYLARLIQSGFPLVLLDRELPHVTMAAAVLDNRGAAYDATSHLLGLGHRRIGLIAGRPGVSVTEERILGYRSALADTGLEYDETFVRSAGSGIAEARRAAEVLLSAIPAPTAIFATNNLITIGAMAAIRDRDLRVPDDVSIISIDDVPWADVFEPRLTTVAQPVYELGRVATNLVVRRIAGDEDAATTRVVLPGHLIIRDSTAPVANRGGTGASRRSRAARRAASA